MITLSDYLVEVERRKDEIALAEQYRLIRQLPRHDSSLAKRCQHLLGRLGELLMGWGYRLQTRFIEDTNDRMVYYRHQSNLVRPGKPRDCPR
jgi:hypothetical protein